MLTIKHLLFPVDFSERVQTTAPFVRVLAERFGADVTLMAVLSPYWEPAASSMLYGGLPAVEPDLEEIRSNLAKRLDHLLLTELAGVPLRRVAELGDPAQTITQFAESEGVDLIAMATHGYGRFRSLLLGSVASKVLHDAQCPVWTAAHTSEPASGSQAACRSVLCAIDSTPKSAPVLEWAAQFAKAMDASLRVVHAVSGVPSWPERQMDREFQAFLQEKAQTAIERQMQASGIQAPLSVLSGDVAEVIRDEALRHSADLVIIGRGLLDEALGRLRSQSYAIIRSAPCPVLSV